MRHRPVAPKVAPEAEPQTNGARPSAAGRSFTPKRGEHPRTTEFVAYQALRGLPTAVWPRRARSRRAGFQSLLELQTETRERLLWICHDDTSRLPNLVSMLDLFRHVGKPRFICEDSPDVTRASTFVLARARNRSSTALILGFAP